jgi:predicted house-cleaning noncanonical NTP pyrophosphatase (MazG superfamily)
MEGNYLILLACDRYDVPSYSKDGEKQDDSTEVFSYFLCSVCPVKLTKPALGYYVSENTFRNITSDWAVSAPELGFLFPAFDDRSADIYSALYYSRNIAENHAEFVDTVFKSEVPMPAAAQKEAFQSILSDAVAEDCSMDVVQAVQGQLSEMIEEHKTNQEEEPLVISKKTVKGILESRGVSESHVAAFEEKYDSEFGADTEISPRNIIDTKQLEVCTPDVTIRVNPERGDMVETRIIDGTRYILIRADEGVEVNGVAIHIS